MGIAVRRDEALRRQQLLANLNSRKRQTASVSMAFLLLLVALFFGIVYTPVVAAYPLIMFCGLIAAGATGALVRSMLGISIENTPLMSFLLGGIAGFVVGLAYLIPQWIGAPGVLEPKASTVTSIDKIQFVSAVLVAISAGVGFDTVFSRLQKQAQDVALTPPAGSPPT